MKRVERALLSVSDKTGLADFAQGLAELGIEILSTGGTAKALRETGVRVTDVSEVTGFPELMDGRVKTLHPRIHGALLARRDVPAHLAACAEHEIGLIDLVAVNLYPFARTVATPGVTLAEAIENIDIGGPSMLRSAAKNYAAVTVICNPARYAEVLAQLRTGDGCTTLATRWALACEVYAHTSEYDRQIAEYLRGVGSE
jgi:phosphoribosylaminoimidazolecarboxamide formyltransferase/IMP cyclohydrolase